VDQTETGQFSITIFGAVLDNVVDAAKFLERHLHEYLRNDFPECWESSFNQFVAKENFKSYDLDLNSE